MQVEKSFYSNTVDFLKNFQKRPFDTNTELCPDEHISIKIKDEHRTFLVSSILNSARSYIDKKECSFPFQYQFYFVYNPEHSKYKTHPITHAILKKEESQGEEIPPILWLKSLEKATKAYYSLISKDWELCQCKHRNYSFVHQIASKKIKGQLFIVKKKFYFKNLLSENVFFLIAEMSGLKPNYHWKIKDFNIFFYPVYAENKLYVAGTKKTIACFLHFLRQKIF